MHDVWFLSPHLVKVIIFWQRGQGVNIIPNILDWSTVKKGGLLNIGLPTSCHQINRTNLAIQKGIWTESKWDTPSIVSTIDFVNGDGHAKIYHYYERKAAKFTFPSIPL